MTKPETWHIKMSWGGILDTLWTMDETCWHDIHQQWHSDIKSSHYETALWCEYLHLHLLKPKHENASLRCFYGHATFAFFILKTLVDFEGKMFGSLSLESSNVLAFLKANLKLWIWHSDSEAISDVDWFVYIKCCVNTPTEPGAVWA